MRYALLRRHPVAAFVALAFLISWGGVFAITLPTGFPGSGDALDRLYAPVFLPMLAGPFLSALIVAASLGGWAGPKRLFKGFAVWRGKPVDYAASFLLIPACSLAVLLALSVISPSFTPGLLLPNIEFPIVALALIGGLVVGAIEETGWTGFATFRLLGVHATLTVAVIIGGIHGVWHLPAVVWSEGAEFGLVLIPYFLTAWVLAITVMRILIVWVFARTGSTALAAVAHASHTGWLFAIWPPSTTPAQDVIWTAAFGALGLAAVASLFHFAPPGDLRARKTS